MTSSNRKYAKNDQFALNFGMAYKTRSPVSVPNLKSFGPMTKDLWAKEDGQFSVMLYGYIGLKLAEIFQIQVIYIV